MNLKSFLLYTIPAIGLLHSCATTNNWQNDDVYTLKEPEVPIGTDINDETDYSAYVYNRRTQERQQKYYSDRQPNSVYRSSYMTMGPSMYMMFGNPYGMGFGYGYGNPYFNRYMGYNPYGGYYNSFYSPYYNSFYGYGGYGGYGYNPYYGYSPYMGMGGYYGYGYGSGYGYSPYYGYGYNSYGYGGSGNYSGSGSSNTFYAHRATYAGVGGTSSRPNGAVQIAKPNTGGVTTTKPVGNVTEKSAYRNTVAPNQTTKEVSGLTTPGSNRGTGISNVRTSQGDFNHAPVVTRTNENVRSSYPVVRGNSGGGSNPVFDGGRVDNGGGGRINSGGNSGVRSGSGPVISSPQRSGGGGMSSPRPSGGGGSIRTGGGGGMPGRR